MKRRFLSNIICISFLAIAGVALFSSCNDDDTVKGYNGPRITIIQENFGSVTRADVSSIIHQETIDMGDGVFMDVTLQEDFGSAQAVATKTRADETFTDISAGEYTIIGYYLDGRYAGENKGTVSYGSDGVGVFNPDPNDTFKFHDGKYRFVCVKNVRLSATRDMAFVTRGTAGDDAALISDYVDDAIDGSVNNGELDIQFTMRHKESGIRFNIKSPGMFDNVNITIAAPGEKPLQHEYALPAVTFNDKTVQSSTVDNVDFTINGGSQYTDYQYFLPGTDAQNISITFNRGKVWGKELNGEIVRLISLTEPLKVNTRYTATINFRDGLPAFDGIIAIGSDGKLTVTAVTDNDLAARTVFFKGGSVIAHGSRRANWKNAEGVNQVVFNPSGIESFENWTDVPYGPTQSITAEYHNAAGNIAAGHGDPCRLVGLTIDQIKSGETDNKLWRLPTRTEYEGSNAGERWIAATDASEANRMGNGYMTYSGRVVTIGTETVFHPALGERHSNEGNLISEEVYARYWSSTYTQNSTETGLPQFSAHRADAPSTEHPNGRLTYGGVDSDRGYTVRCVRQEVVLPPGTGGTDKVPAFDYIIAIGSDGKLTLEGSKDENARTVYFKFGSTIAQSTVSGEWNSDGVAYNPTDCPNTDYNLWDAIPYGNATHTYDNVKAGMGDPCRLVGIDKDKITMSYFDNRTWRLPTYDENTKATVISPAYGVTVSGNYVGKFIKMIEDDGASGLFYPASGRRDMTTGNYEGQKYRGYYWTSTPWGTNENKENAYSLYFDNNSSGVNKEGYNEMKYGFAVRCVPQTP